MPTGTSYKTDFVFKFGEQEWSYDFGQTSTSAATLAATWQARPAGGPQARFIDALVAFHGSGVKLARVEVRNRITKQRDTRSPELNIVSASHEVTDVTNNSLFCEMFGENGAYATKTFSGLPDAMIERDSQGNMVQNALFNARWSPLQIALVDCGFGIYTKDPAAADSWKKVRLMEPDSVAVANVATQDAGYTKFTTVGDHGFATNDIVTFERRPVVRETQYLAGNFRVVSAPTVTTFILATEVNFRGDSFKPKYLRVREPVFSLQNIQQIVPVDWGTRQRGQGGGPRGKRSSKKYKNQ